MDPALQAVLGEYERRSADEWTRAKGDMESLLLPVGSVAELSKKRGA